MLLDDVLQVPLLFFAHFGIIKQMIEGTFPHVLLIISLQGGLLRHPKDQVRAFPIDLGGEGRGSLALKGDWLLFDTSEQVLTA